MRNTQTHHRPFPWLARRAAFLSWCSGLAALTSFIPDAQPPFESLAWLAGLASHWQWVYAATGLPLCALALVGRHRHVVLPLAAIVAGFLHQAPAAQAPESHSTHGTHNAVSERELSVASANLNYARTDHGKLQAWLASSEAPDVIVLQEFTDAAHAAVTHPAIKTSHPHQWLAPSADQFGLALLSRHPVRSAEWVQAQNALATLKLRVVLNVRGQNLALTALHPMPPISAAYARERDESLQDEAQRLARGTLPGVLVGDLNATPWSSGLHKTAPLRRASTLRPTWPNAWGWLSLLPLDHVLVTAGVSVLPGDPAPDLGSDHRPVQVRLLLPRGP